MISKSSSRSITKKSVAKQGDRSARVQASKPAIAFSLIRGRTGLNVTAHGATALVLAVAVAAVMVMAAMRVSH